MVLKPGQGGSEALTGIFMLGGFVLFLINKKWSRAALVCLVPVCALAAYFTADDRLGMIAACTGITIIAASPLIEHLAGLAHSRLSGSRTGERISEDDILDNKTKWRLILAGYAVFILFAIFAIISIIRLNAKINTLYSFTQEMDQRIEEVNDTKK